MLGRGGDVELVIDRTNASGRVVGGHVAMVTGMKKIAPHVRQITYVDDPVQGDGVAASREHVIVVSDLNGNFTRGFVRGSCSKTSSTSSGIPGRRQAAGTVGSGVGPGEP